MSAEMRMQAAAGVFERRFGAPPHALCDAPGRVNLIGEHIDYAGGSVLPCAIQLGIGVAAAPAGDSPAGTAADIDLCCAPDSPVQLDAAQLATALRLAHEVVTRLYAHGRMRRPAERAAQWRLAAWSDLPACGGLSSSAAFCVAIAGSVCAALDVRGLTPLALCRLCRNAEEAATGVQCGLMDQYAVMFGQAGQAVHFDTQMLTHEYIPLELPDAVFAVIDSGQPRSLAASGYNQRRAELAAGHRLRLRHAASEQERVRAACAALRARDSAALGRLLDASQASLRDDYSVSTPELDLLCALLGKSGLAYGSRLTGAGFGGSVLALLCPAALEPDARQRRPIDTVLTQYAQQTGMQPVLRPGAADAGARVRSGTGDACALSSYLDGGAA